MSYDPGPVDLKVRIEGLVSSESKPFELLYKIDSRSNFDLSQIITDLHFKINTDPEYNEAAESILKEFVSFQNNPELQILEDDNSSQSNNMNPENEPFITDYNDLKIFWKNDRYVVENQTKKVIDLLQNKNYLMIYKLRTLINQRKDLLNEIDFVPRMRLNIYVENQITSEVIIYKFSNIFLANLSSDEFKDATVEIILDDDYVEISLESLLKGELRKKDQNVKLSFMNYLAFRISEPKKNPLPSDEALSISFDSILMSSGSSEKERLKSCIKMVNRVKKDSQNYFYTPFLNVCQSSGSGKTKIATELMFEVPSFYAVLREEVISDEGDGRTQCGYPYMSSISKLFLNVTTPKNPYDDTKNVQGHTSTSIVGRYLLLIKALLSDYVDALETELEKNGKNLTLALESVYKKIMDGTFTGNDLKFFDKNPTWTKIYLDSKTNKFQLDKNSNSTSLTMKTVTEACHQLLGKIDSIRNSLPKYFHDYPFFLIIDEASLLIDKKPGVNLFRHLRRAVNRLGRGSNFIVVTLGTNSDVLDLNPDLSFDSFRESVGGRVFPPFILSRNWDLFLDYEELKKYSFGYNEMLEGRMILFWFSLGRPLWSSISFSRLIGFIQVKICNNRLKSGEAYLAFWMVRVGLLVNPAHVITQYLLKSLMATLLYASPDLKHMRVYYPSEPALAVGIRSMLMNDDNILEYYSNLEKFIKSRAIDTGRFAEIISGDICLLAIAKSQSKRKSCKWKYDEKKLPKVCSAKSFILETSDFHTTESKTEINNLNVNMTDETISDLFDQHYIIIEAIDFVKGLYSLDGKKYVSDQQKHIIMGRIELFVPELMKAALLNMTHYTQFSTKFPFESYTKGFGIDFKMTVAPMADSRYSKGHQLCNQITAEVLESMIMRGSGIMLAPNTFGLDHVIPVCFKPSDSDSHSKPEYSFIGVQVKRGSISNIRPIVAKGAVSNHYVRCGKHGESGRCQAYDCEFRISDNHFKRILENGFMLIHSLTDDYIDPNETDLSKYIPELEESLKKLKLDAENYSILCETSLPEAAPLIQELLGLKIQSRDKKITVEEYNDRKKAIDNNLKKLIVNFCPPEFLAKIDKFEFGKFEKAHYDNCRFVPDVYFAVEISSELSVHCMVKKRSDDIMEKIVAIHSKGIEAFSNVLPAQARNTARRIIFYDQSVFDEITYDPKVKERPSIRYTELITSVVSRNNSSSIPIANNYIRSKYGQPLIPHINPDYEKIDTTNIKENL